MTNLEIIIDIALQRLKHDLAGETWKSRYRYFNQMMKLAESLNITEPCQELYNAFIADDNGSKERRSMHFRCVKLIDALADTRATDGKGILFNEHSLPTEAEVHEYFLGANFPIPTGVPIDYLIINANFSCKLH